MKALAYAPQTVSITSRPTIRAGFSAWFSIWKKVVLAELLCRTGVEVE